MFVDDDELPEMKLEDGQSTYVELYASRLVNGTVRVWSIVSHGSFVLQKGLVIEKITVLGLQGAGRGIAVEVDGEPLSDVSGVRFSETSPRRSEKVEEEAQINGMTVDVGGLALPLGKNFSVSWKMVLVG